MLYLFRNIFINRLRPTNVSLLLNQSLRKFCDTKDVNKRVDKKISAEEEVKVIYVSKDGQKTQVIGRVGDNAMYLAHNNNIEIEGACEASLACCTCHVYVDPQYYKKIPEPKEEEEDMLDMAPFLKPNSRLSLSFICFFNHLIVFFFCQKGCQIILTKELDGIQLTLPLATRNFYVDGKKPTPH